MKVKGVHSVVMSGFLKVYQLGDSNGPKEDSHVDSPARRVAYSSCGRWMALGEDEGIIRLWDLQSCEDELLLEEHSEDIVKLVFLPNGRQLVSLDYGGIICLWDTESGECIDVLELYGSYISASPCGNILAIAGDNLVHLWDLQQQQERATLTGFENIASMEWSPGGTWIAVGCDNNTVRLRKISNEGHELKGNEAMVIRDFLGWTFSMTWSPTDPMEFATGSIDGSVCTWRIVRGENESHVQLMWNSSTSRLTTSGTRIDKVIGPSEMQRILLMQRGAIDGSIVPGTEQPPIGIVRHTEGDRKAHVVEKTLFYR